MENRRSTARLLVYLMGIALGASLLLGGCATIGPAARTAAPQVSTAGAERRVDAADATLQRGDPKAALAQLRSLPANLPSAVRRHALDVEARAHLAMGDRLSAARLLAQRLPLVPAAEQASEHQRIIAILAGMGSTALTSLYPMLPGNDPVRPFVQQALAHAGAAASQALPQPANPVGTSTGTSLPQGFAMPAHVALLLPSSGPIAVAAAAVRDGFFAAYFHTPASQEQRPTVRVYDTGGTPDGAVAAYQQAVSHGASLVVGPLGRAAVGAVLAQATLPVPVLALNQPQGQQPIPAGSVEFGLMPETEGAELAAHMATAGLRTAIVFRGDGPLAERTFTAFKAEFKSLGGHISNDVVLPRSAVDFQGQVQGAVAGAAAQTGIVALLRPEQARLLLPQLKIARSALPVFSTSMVYSGSANTVANGDLDGVQFSDEPWLYNAQAGLPGHAALAAQLSTAAGPAARLFGFGMDGYALVPYIDWLRNHPGSYLAGATGELTIDAAGQVQRTPIWVQFEGGSAVPVAAGLQMQPATTATPAQP